MMNLLFVCDEYPPMESGGYAQLSYDLANGLREIGHIVTVLCVESKLKESGVAGFGSKSAYPRPLLAFPASSNGRARHPLP